MSVSYRSDSRLVAAIARAYERTLHGRNAPRRRPWLAPRDDAFPKANRQRDVVREQRTRLSSGPEPDPPSPEDPPAGVPGTGVPIAGDRAYRFRRGRWGGGGGAGGDGTRMLPPGTDIPAEETNSLNDAMSALEAATQLGPVLGDASAIHYGMHTMCYLDQGFLGNNMHYPARMAIEIHNAIGHAVAAVRLLLCATL